MLTVLINFFSPSQILMGHQMVN